MRAAGVRPRVDSAPRRPRAQTVPALTSRGHPRGELDGPWKEALGLFLSDFLALLQPRIHEAVDWSRPYESLDTELQQLSRGARVGRRLADRLFRVWRRDGEETWILVHIEVQARKECDFAERMFVYGYRIFDHFRRPAVSLAVLCDKDPAWRPDTFGYTIWGSSVDFRFLTVKLLDHWSDVAALESNPNPFAAFVLAHRKAIETRRCPEVRGKWKLRVVEGLYDRGLKSGQVRGFFRLIDWMMQLPEELEREFLVGIRRVEKERCMPYVMSAERLARQEGLEKGLEEGLEQGREEGLREGLAIAVELRFGASGRRLLLQIRALHDVKKLRAVARALKSGKTLEDLERLVG